MINARSNARRALSKFSSSRTMTSSTSPDARIFFVRPGAPADSASNEGQKLWSTAHTSASNKALDTRVVFGDAVTSLVSLGEASAWAKKGDAAKREAVRKAAGKGVGQVKDLALSADIKSIEVDASDEVDAHAAAVGAKLGLHSFTLKTKKDANPGKGISITPSTATDIESWKRGEVYADAQILARELMELPANLMTPTKFCERVLKEAEGLKNVEVIVHDEREKALGRGERDGTKLFAPVPPVYLSTILKNSFLSVTHGTSEPAKFLEIHYKGEGVNSQAQPLALVGKGITFDSGGISLKPGANMKLMRGDMGGAATVTAATLAIARLGLALNIVTVIPLTENMPGPSATKPGDIIYAMNGKSIEVDNTDAEGRLVLADALTYASRTFNPHTVIDVATLTGAMLMALGHAFSGVFSTSDSLWSELHTAGEHEFDRMWRMPLDDAFLYSISGSNADLMNTGKPAGSCTAALFLKHFVDGLSEAEGEEGRVRWAHIDIAGSMEADKGEPYQYKGMTGRPTRALIEFARRLAAKEN